MDGVTATGGGEMRYAHINGGRTHVGAARYVDMNVALARAWEGRAGVLSVNRRRGRGARIEGHMCATRAWARSREGASRGCMERPGRRDTGIPLAAQVTALVGGA